MKKLSFLLFLLIMGIGLGFIWWNNGTQAVNRKDTSQKIFVIPRGAVIREIGNSLKKENLIRDPVVFFIFLKLQGKDKNIQAGDYKLSPSMSLGKLVETLNHGTLDTWVTFQEGMRAEEFAKILKDNVKNYNDEWPAKLALYEGYLFPDTYLIPKDADIDRVISIMRNTFFSKVSELGLSKDSPNLNKIVIVASLLEREARGDEKPTIAGIINNRLANGIPLQIDATVQYAKGYDVRAKTWWPQITLDDYKSVISPYNTYLATGLPPHPISNPGLASLKAALNPASTDYIYYLHDSKGKIHYAKSLQEHERNVRKYLE